MIPNVMKWYECVQRFFGIFFIGGIFLGLVFPGVFSFFSGYIVLILACVMTLAFLEIDLSSLFKNLKKIHIVFLVWIVFKILLPGGIYFAAGRLFSGAVAVSLLLLALSPIATISTALTRLFKGDDTFILLFLVVSTLAAPFHLPFMMKSIAGREVYIDAASMMLTLLKLIIFPFAGALLLRRFAKPLVVKSQPYFAAISILLVMILISGIIGDGVDYIYHNLAKTLELLGIGYAFGIVLGLLGFFLFFPLEREKRLGLSVAVIYMNLALSIVLAKTFLPEEVVLFCVLYELPVNTLPSVLFFLQKKGIL